jgi:hypothetical protein
MDAKSQFNISDRAWILIKSESGQLAISEVIIEGISIDFGIDKEGEVLPHISYYIRKKNGKHLDDDFIDEQEVFADFEDLKAKMETIFTNRIINFPKIYSLSDHKISDAA